MSGGRYRASEFTRVALDTGRHGSILGGVRRIILCAIALAACGGGTPIECERFLNRVAECKERKLPGDPERQAMERSIASMERDIRDMSAGGQVRAISGFCASSEREFRCDG